MCGCFACIAEELRFRLLQARLRHAFCLCTGALFFFLGGSKGAVLDPPHLLCRSSVLSGVWLFRMRCRGAAFSASPGSAAPCFLSMYWGAFLLLRGFQRCRFGPAAGTFFLLCLSSDLSGVWLFRMHCRGATKHFPLAQVI